MLSVKGDVILRSALAQTDWYINGVTGDDEKDGATSGTALKTFKEWTDRMASLVAETGLVAWPKIYIETDLTEDDFVVECHVPYGLEIYGTRTVLATGSITAKQDWNAAAATDGQIEDTALAVSWTDSGLVGEMIVLSSGANAGALAWIAKDLGAKTARHSPFTRSNVMVHPTIGDTYEIVTLTKLTGAFSLKYSGYAVIITDLRFAGSAPLWRGVDLEVGSSSFNNCKFSDDANIKVKSGIALQNCYVGKDLDAFGGQVGNQTGGLFTGRIRLYDGVNFSLYGSMLLQNTSIRIEGGSFFMYYATGCIGYYDQATATDAPVLLQNGAVFKCAGKIFGTDNLGLGIDVRDGSRFIYTAGDDISDHLDVQGTLTAEVRCGGLDTTYVAIGANGIVHAINGAAVTPGNVS